MSIGTHSQQPIESRKPVEYWNHKRPQHWTVYPNFPINTGIVRQKYRDLAKLYDTQQIIHPTVVGFSLRYQVSLSPPSCLLLAFTSRPDRTYTQGNRQDEVNFIHPMFMDFSLVKKPLPRIVLEEIKRQAQLNKKTNPFQYRPLVECPICYDHQPGCPRCFEMPTLPNGDPMRPVDFQFDPELEQREKAERDFKESQRQLVRITSLSHHSLSVSVSVSVSLICLSV
jgi:hypothetical protein